MRDHHTKAPAPLRRLIQDKLDGGDCYGAILAAINNGYDFPPGEVPTTHRDRVAALQDNPAEAASYKLRHADLYRSEVRAYELSTKRRTWAAEGPSKAEEAEAAAKAREAAAKAQERAVAARLKELRSQQGAEAEAALLAQARRDVGAA